MLVPFWPFDPDTLSKIRFIENQSLINMNNHHLMRWGSYLPIKIISIIWGIDFISLTLTSFFFFVLSSTVFLYIAHRFFGLLYSLIFLTFWLTSKSLSLEIFSLSVVNQSLLPLATILLALIHLKNNQKSTFSIFLLSLAIFWAYGVKETNLFFFPLLFLLKIFKENPLIIFKILLFGLILYFLETIVLYFFSDQYFIFGRIIALITSETGHINEMLIGYGSEHFSSLSKFESYFLPSYRWYSARDWDTTIFYLSFIISIFYLFNSSIKNQIIHINSVLIISFFTFTTFFIVSFSPLVMGQPLATRFLTVLLPFSFIIIISFLQHIINSSSNKHITIILLCVVLITFFSRPMYSLVRLNENWGYLSLISHYGYSSWDRNQDYKKLAEKINSYDCMIINSSNPFVKNIAEVSDLFINKKLDISNWQFDNFIFKKNRDIKCINSITIKENGILF
tara:strand:- start:4938 stop:6293 length:1356 start_codon:yes stop_codon:yes gene_type:complete